MLSTCIRLKRAKTSAKSQAKNILLVVVLRCDMKIRNINTKKQCCSGVI